ncbi:MAG: hypothetical protein FJY73_09155 [Candidatus Eisenbacteria bacterium]|nr:hypothetical protein [Candidatus Eisenbacteria bacterium]
MGGLTLSLQRGHPVLLLLALALSFLAAYWAYRRTLPPLPDGARRLLTGIRFAAFGVLSLLLLDPLLVRESVETIRPSVAVLVDASGSMGIADRAAEGEEGTRRAEVAERLLREEPYSILAKLGKRYEVSERRFAAGLESSEGELGIDATDLSRALEGAALASWERGLDGIVLLTDGIVNAGRDPVRVAEEIGIPVFPIPIGDPTPPRDLAVEQVLANPLVYVKSRVAAEATIRAKGFAGEEVRVLLKEGETVLAEERVRFEGRRESRTVPFSFEVSEPGVRRYAVEVPVWEGERLAENNRVLFTVEVVKERLELLIAAEKPSWDFAFLRRTLERDPNVRARFFVQGRDGKPRSVGDREIASFPYGDEELARTDLVLLVGVPDAAGRDWGERLQRFVRERGGALVLFAADPIASVPPPLADLLPVAPPERGIDHDPAPFAMRLTEPGKRHPMLRVHPDAERTEEIWGELPPLLGWNRIGPARPGSVLLASHPRLDVEGSEGPVLAFRAAGKGRVLFVNGGGMWRWGFRVRAGSAAEGIYDRFWSNAIRWLVARDGFRNVTVKPERMTYDRGEQVAFRALVADESLVPISDARVEGTLTGPDGAERRFFLEPDPAEPGAYRRVLGPLAPGEYSYLARAARGDLSLGEDSGELTVGEFSAEFLETERDDGLLRRVARASGGEVLPAEEIASWPGDLGLTARARRVREEREIWNHALFFVLLVALFSTEWFLRKRYGLS